MDERRRFAVAMSGVLGTIGLAAGIALTGPGLQTVTPVAAPARMAAARPLTALAIPAVTVPEPRHAPLPRGRRASRPGPTVVSTVLSPTDSAVPVAVTPQFVRAVNTPPHSSPDSPARLQATTHAVLLTGAPQAHGESAFGLTGRPEGRDPVASAFVVAGSEVGAGFKTVGRTIRRLF
jgi:hypothetical protein